MFLFLRLLLAHFIADFPLQTDEIYRLKIKGHLGQFIHVFIIVAVSAVFCGPYLALPAMWALLILVGVIHYIIDWTKVIWKDRINHKWTFVQLVIDQILHISVYLPILFTNLNKTRGIVVKPRLWAQFYNSNNAVTYAIFFILAVFSSFYFIETAKMSYFPNLVLKKHPRAMNYYETLERFLIFTAAYFSGIYLLFIPAVILLRVPVSRFVSDGSEAKAVFLSRVNIALNAGFAAACGIALSIIL